ncbi:S1C family serine protease [Pseudalkalibacillus berkeleyi]|uniref:S1C family serine protease n=1 Tax=Pseudalkalibacillus berkeleyi TaxID=1069813 RepID=A0ABS9H264_9BACL|nr:trypsin-like peptidase domain-containing protein [Pseudalkalibacillus berkeleyi]MCF6138999.1 S1C family serine protease [Pseudalkalibacillus berkeleyi]
MSILITSLILLVGIAGAFVINNYYSHYTVEATSSIGDAHNEKRNAPSVERDLKSIIHESQKGVVQLDVESDAGKSVGSGFLYNENGDIVTNAHVVTGAKKITVRTADAQQYEGKLIGIGESTDVAVVRVLDLQGQSPLPVMEDHVADIGDEIIALGSPLGLQNSVTTGIISGLDRDFALDHYTYSGVYQISAPIAPGNSGGPLINKSTGEVMAINSAGTEEGSIGFSIPMKDVYDQLLEWSKHPENLSKKDQEPNTDHDVTPKLNAEDSEYLVKYFYDSLVIGDYVTAYSLLGSEWQKNTPYEKFRKSYIQTIDITINQIKSEPSKEENTMKVTIIIDALERKKDRETKTYVYKCSYTISYENNQLKIISGQTTKIE